MAIDGVIDRAFVQIGVRRERTLEIIQVGQQRLFVLHVAGGDEADGAAARAHVEQPHGACGVLVRDRDALRLVSHFERQLDLGYRAVLAARNCERRRREHLAPCAKRKHIALPLAGRARTNDRDLESVRLVILGQQRERHLAERIGKDG